MLPSSIETFFFPGKIPIFAECFFHHPNKPTQRNKKKLAVGWFKNPKQPPFGWKNNLL